MEYVHSALLLHEAGEEVNEENVTQVLEAAGIEADSARVKSLIAALDGVDIEEAMSTAVASGAAPAQPASSGQEEASEESEEEAEEEEEAEDEGAGEDAEAGLGELF